MYIKRSRLQQLYTSLDSFKSKLYKTLVRKAGMKILLSILLIGSLGPLLAQAATFEDFTFYGNGSAVVLEKPKKHAPTAEQKVLIDQFRKKHKNLLTDDYLRSESHISGLLEANKWNENGALKMLRRVLTWRSRTKVDDLNHVDPDPTLLKLFPWAVDVRTRDGCPVLQIGWGKWLVADYIQSQEFVRDGVNTYNRHSDSMWERGRFATKNLVPKCEQAIIIADIKGFLMKNVAEANALNTVVRMALTLNDKYSNLYETILCINAPPDFITLMKTLQPSLGVTAKAFNIYSEEEADKARKHVAAYVDLAQLTPDYLGTKTVA